MKALGYFKPQGGGGGGMGNGMNHNENNEMPNNMMMHSRGGPQKPLEEVTCFKCGTKGHYANRCPKGHLAFLSQAKLQPQQSN